MSVRQDVLTALRLTVFHLSKDRLTGGMFKPVKLVLKKTLQPFVQPTTETTDMIKPEDFDFHFTANSHWQWVETIALPFHVPEANINGGVYLVTRPMLGVAMCDISLHDRLSDLWEEQLYIDNQQHLPCPASLSEFSLPNGLSLKVIEPLKHY